MATSGSTDFTVTRNELIRDAALLIGAVRASQTMNAQMVTDFARRLNAMAKHWQGKGLHVWTVSEATLFPQPNQQQYALSSASGSDHATQSFVSTTLSAAAGMGVVLDGDATVATADRVDVVADAGASLNGTTSVGSAAAMIFSDAMTNGGDLSFSNATLAANTIGNTGVLGGFGSIEAATTTNDNRSQRSSIEPNIESASGSRCRSIPDSAGADLDLEPFELAQIGDPVRQRRDVLDEREAGASQFLLFRHNENVVEEPVDRLAQIDQHLAQCGDSVIGFRHPFCGPGVGRQ